jgi:hypothetical protein
MPQLFALSTNDPSFTTIPIERCKSIKAKRLFLYLAETTEQPCFGKLRLTKRGMLCAERRHRHQSFCQGFAEAFRRYRPDLFTH